jgi:hypothetical protein
MTQTSTGTPVTVAGLHLSPNYDDASDCRRDNIDKLRSELAGINERTIVAGDFNRRAMLKERECDPEELSETLAWWDSMTRASDVDGHSYKDSVRFYRRTNELELTDQWTHEQPNVSILCDDSENYKRGRIDYAFASDGVKIIEAGVDSPGWAVEGEPGAIGCSTPGCKYSDHRFLWARFEIAPLTPVDPVDVTATPVNSTTIEVGWRDVTEESSYRVERSSGEAPDTWVAVGTVAKDSTSFGDGDLSPETTYNYRAIAVNQVGESLPSSVASATTPPDTDAPTAPQDLKLTAAKRTVSATWTASTDSGGSGLGGYEIWRQEKKGDPSVVGTTSETSYVDTTAKQGHTYSYFVTAYDNAGNRSTPSNKVTIKVL